VTSFAQRSPNSDAAAAAAIARVPRLIEQTEQLGILYAAPEWAPTSDLTFAIALKNAGVRWRYVPLGGITEIVWPPLCGIHRMYIDSEQTPGEKRLGIRHGFAHVLDGHVADLTYSHDGHDAFGYRERVADLYALADLIPNRALADCRESGFTSWEIEWWIWCEIKRYAPSWPTARLVDRIGLRLALEAGGR
jgi:hypothetical protein